MPQFDPSSFSSQLFWLIICFGTLYWIVARFIIPTIRETLENTPPELAADIGERGMVIAGGGALIRDMDRRLMQETGLPVVIADDPLTCVARGCGRALEDMAVLGDVFTRE